MVESPPSVPGRREDMNSNPLGRIGRTLSMFSRRRKSRVPSCCHRIFVSTVFQNIGTIWNRLSIAYGEQIATCLIPPRGPK